MSRGATDDGAPTSKPPEMTAGISLVPESPSSSPNANESNDRREPEGGKNGNRMSHQSKKSASSMDAVSGSTSADSQEDLFQLRDVWNKPELLNGTPKFTSAMTKAAQAQKTRGKSLFASGSAGHGNLKWAQAKFYWATTQFSDSNLGGMYRCIVHPNSYPRLSWDVAGMILILYDIITIPLFMAFDPPVGTEILACFYATLFFWTLDIPFSFLTGYYDAGVIEMRPAKIARHYLSRWFLLDMIVVGCDWFFLIATGGPGATEAKGVRYGKTLRAMRVLRSARLLRIIRLKKIIEAMEDCISSAYTHIFIDVSKLLVAICMINHIVACIWFGIGVDDGWVVEDGFTQFSLHYQYTTSVHWALTQFTPGSMEVFPTNAWERTYNVLMLLLGLIIFSSFVSSITAAMTRLRELGSRRDRQVTILRRYLKDHGVSQQLAVRIKKFVEHSIAHMESRIQEKDVELLALLSVPLKMDLCLEEHKPLLMEHPFFQQYADEDGQALRQVCYIAITHISLSEGDALFTSGTRGEKMYILQRGMLRYQRMQSTWQGNDRRSKQLKLSQKANRSILCSGSDECLGSQTQISTGPVKWMHERQYCCEASLWAPWTHVGTLRAKTMVDVMAVDAAKFGEATTKYHHMAVFAVKYGHTFVEKLNQTPWEDLSDLTDMSDESMVGLYSQGFQSGDDSDEEELGKDEPVSEPLSDYNKVKEGNSGRKTRFRLNTE